MAHPARSLPPLSFGDPDLDAPANDTKAPVDDFVKVPTLTFADAPPSPARVEAAREAVAAPPPVYEVPSIIPEAAKDPSFETAPPAKPSWVANAVATSSSLAPAAPAKLPELVPAPPDLSIEERVTELLERIFERLPPWPEQLRLKVPAGAAFALALVVLWCQLGFAIHSMRAFFAAANKLGE
jgi:hypothetical protein